MATGDRSQKEGGFVVVYVALSMLFLMAMASFAVDVGNWHLQGQRQQRAADSAALGGVVFMPDSFSTAQSVALASAGGNGFGGGQVNVASVSGRPNQLQVTVTQTVNNYFGSLLGRPNQTVIRRAIAEYQGPVPMGSPTNGVGNEPLVRCNLADFTGPTAVADYNACVAWEEHSWVRPSSQGQFWMHISSPARLKSTGDAFASHRCATGPGRPDCPITDTNNDYQTDGYFFTVRSPTAGQRLVISAFDPAWINVGDNCDANIPNWATMDATVRARIWAEFPDARYRYARAQSPFCTGDNAAGGTGGTNTGVTTYIVRAPDNTPWTDLDNPVACTAQFSGFNGALQNRLDPASAEFDQLLPDGRTVRQVWRRWLDICTVNSSLAGDYIVQVRSNVPLTAQPATAAPDLTLGSIGAGNRLAMRAAYASGSGPYGAAAHGGISVFASGRIGVFVNAEGATSQFYLARVFPDAAGRFLTLSLYDLSDYSCAGACTPAPLRVVIVPPSGSLNGACTLSLPTAAAQPSMDASTCTMRQITPGSLEARWARITIRIPDTYTCDPSDVSDCWFRLTYEFPTNARPQDTTSWDATVNGDPVRLIG